MTSQQSTDAVGAVHQEDDQGRSDASQQTAGALPDPVQQIRAQVAAETLRINKIRQLCAGKHPEFVAEIMAA